MEATITKLNSADLVTCFHGNPNITYTGNAQQRSPFEYEHIFKIYNNIIDFTLITNKSFSLNNASYLFIKNIFFIKNNEKYYPDKFILTYKNNDIVYHGKCMNNFFESSKDLFNTPLVFDENIFIKTESEPDEIYVEILSVNKCYIGSIRKTYANFWEKSAVFIKSHNQINSSNSISIANNFNYEINISNNLTENTYINKIYLFLNNIYNISNITLTAKHLMCETDYDTYENNKYNTKLVLYDNVSPIMVSKENKYIVLTLGVKNGTNAGYFFNKKYDELILNFNISYFNEKIECIIEKYELFGLPSFDCGRYIHMA